MNINGSERDSLLTRLEEMKDLDKIYLRYNVPENDRYRIIQHTVPVNNRDRDLKIELEGNLATQSQVKFGHSI